MLTFNVTYDYAKNTELIILESWHGNIKREHTIKSPLFQTVCDFLSLDFIKILRKYLINAKTGFEKSDGVEEALKIFSENHSRLISDKLLESISRESLDQVPYCSVSIFIFLQLYLESLARHNWLFNEDIFHAAIREQFASVVEIPRFFDLEELKDMAELGFEDMEDNRVMFEDFMKTINATESNKINIRCKDVDDFCTSSIFHAIKNRFLIKRCANCGIFFVPFNRSDEIYCDRISPRDKNRTCKEYGSQRLWYERMKTDEAAKLRRNVYSAKQMLARRNPDIAIYRESFEKFKTEDLKWFTKIKRGEATREEYIAWLHIVKQKKVL